MEKYDLSNCSIVIPVKIDSKERLDNLYFLLRYFTLYFTNYDMIVVEQGKERKIKYPETSGLQFLFIESDDDSFNLTQIANSGASRVNNPFFCKCDTDVLIHPKAIYTAFERLKTQPNLAFILPYNGVAFSIDGWLKEELMLTYNFSQLPFTTPKQAEEVKVPHLHLKNKKTSLGLIHHFRTSVFKALGGYNETFVGWGFDDNEIIARFNIMGYPMERLEDYVAFHLSHPVQKIDQELVKKNRERLHQVEKMTPEQLRQYIDSWSRFT